MAGAKSDAEEFAKRWASRGDENQETQFYWIDLFQRGSGLGTLSSASGSRGPWSRTPARSAWRTSTMGSPSPSVACGGRLFVISRPSPREFGLVCERRT